MPRKKLTEEEEIARVKAMYEYEHNCRDNGYTVVAGVDEAGRGPLAGPVYAAAVILPNDIIIKGINDSKKLSEKKREELFEEITEKAIAYNIFSVDEKRIDEINILNATYEAMNGAVNGLSTAPNFVLIDGNRISGMERKFPKSVNPIRIPAMTDKTMQPGIFSIRGDNSLQANSAIRYQRENFGLVK